MAHIPRAICTTCRREMKCVKNGILVEMMKDGDSPYYRIRGDEFACECGMSIVVGMVQPSIEHWEKGYSDREPDLVAWFA